MQKGHKLEYLLALDFYQKALMTASLRIELEKENEREELRSKLLKDEKGYPVITF